MEVKSQISWDFQGQTLPKNNKKMADFVGIFRAVSLEIDHFSADETTVFNVSLTEINRSFVLSTTIYTPEMNQRQSFQHHG